MAGEGVPAPELPPEPGDTANVEMKGGEDE
jgi:hypothetical protein